MAPEDFEIKQETVRIPPNCRVIELTPAFGGGFILRFVGTGGGYLGAEVVAPAGLTFHPDSTITYPTPFAGPTDIERTPQ